MDPGPELKRQDKALSQRSTVREPLPGDLRIINKSDENVEVLEDTWNRPDAEELALEEKDSRLNDNLYNGSSPCDSS